MIWKQDQWGYGLTWCILHFCLSSCQMRWGSRPWRTDERKYSLKATASFQHSEPSRHPTTAFQTPSEGSEQGVRALLHQPQVHNGQFRKKDQNCHHLRKHMMISGVRKGPYSTLQCEIATHQIWRYDYFGLKCCSMFSEGSFVVWHTQCVHANKQTYSSVIFGSHKVKPIYAPFALLPSWSTGLLWWGNKQQHVGPGGGSIPPASAESWWHQWMENQSEPSCKYRTLIMTENLHWGLLNYEVNSASIISPVITSLHAARYSGLVSQSTWVHTELPSILLKLGIPTLAV